MPVQIAEVVFGGDGSAEIELQENFLTELVVQLGWDEIDSAPSALLVSVYDAMALDDLVFKVLGREVFRHEPDPDGGLEAVSVPVPDLRDSGQNHLMQPGTYTLEVTQASAIGTAEFTIANPPEEVPEEVQEDAPPGLVPGTIQPNGTRRWVFQDLMPDGIGSWVMPMNPVDMGSPPFERELTAKATTLSDEMGGQFHIWENEWTPVEWTFSGYCPSEEMREKLEAYYELERRWYLHDHRGRAWKVTFQALELTPRLTQIWNGQLTNEGHDYQAIVLVTEREWVDV